MQQQRKHAPAPRKGSTKQLLDVPKKYTPAEAAQVHSRRGHKRDRFAASAPAQQDRLLSASKSKNAKSKNSNVSNNPRMGAPSKALKREDDLSSDIDEAKLD